MADYRNVTACRLCDSTELASVLNLGRTPLANELWSRKEVGAPLCEHDDPECDCAGNAVQDKFPLVVNRCGSCGHHQLSIAVKPERLWGPNYPYQSGTSPVFRKHLEALADEVAALKTGWSVLEIGSNDGTLCSMLMERGMDAWGIDPSGPESCLASGMGRRNLLRKAWPIDFGGRKFGCILALNVFAHVDDLHSFTAAVKEALAPDGVFIVEVGYLPSVVHRGHFDTVYHEHFSYHTARPLCAFFGRHGLKIEKAQTVASQGGSVRLYVGHDHMRVPGFFVVNEEVDIGQLRSVIDSRAAALRAALNKLFQREEMVCIYGAPAKLTTLLYATGLDKMPFNCVGDDNPRKVGRTTPGNHIPIVSVEEMLARKPDTILVASWNFFDDIRRKLRDAGFKGGIINPMGDS